MKKLTNEELFQLSELDFVRATLTYKHSGKSFECFLDDYDPTDNVCITCILPDREKFFRVHVGNKQIVPDEVVIEIIDNNDELYQCKSKDVNWSNFSSSYNKFNIYHSNSICIGYRIIGVKF